MKYRKFGNTGLAISEIGIGCEEFGEERLKMTIKLFDKAEWLGINHFDLYTSNSDIR